MRLWTGLAFACVVAACGGAPTVSANYLVVTTRVKPSTFSMRRDSGAVRVILVARNPEPSPLDVDMRGPLRVPLAPYQAVLGESARALTTAGISFGVRVMHGRQSMIFDGWAAGAWTVHFGAGESHMAVYRYSRADLFGRMGLRPGEYSVIGSFGQQEAPPVRLVITP